MELVAGKLVGSVFAVSNRGRAQRTCGVKMRQEAQC